MDEEDQYWKRPTVSSTASGAGKLPSVMSPDRPGQDRLTWISSRARGVLSSYRKDDFADPDGYLVNLGCALERYSDALIAEATHPATGIQGTCKWPPSIAEVVEFCDALKRRAEYPQSWDERSKQQIAERERIARGDEREPLEHRKRVAERILKEYHAAINSKNGLPP